MNSIENLVSIIIPVYNAERFLSETLDCLLSQTYEDIEVILVDDGSKDSSKVICEKYVEADKRFSYYYQDNAGAGAARNQGIDLAHGEFLMFLDSDDLFEPEFVEKMHGAIAGEDVDVVVCRADKFNSVYVPDEACLLHSNALLGCGIYRPEDIGDRFYQLMTTCPWDKLFRAEHIANEGLRFQDLRYSNDTYFVLMALLTASQIAVTEDVLVHYRYGLGGSLRDKMYLNPYCDLDMLASLRDAFVKTDLACNIEIRHSFEDFFADIIAMACMNLASQSEDACRDFMVCLRQIGTPDLKDLLRRPVSREAIKRAYKYWAVTTVSTEGIVWAVSLLGSNGWRSANASQLRSVWSRVLVAPVALAWRSIRRAGRC